MTQLLTCVACPQPPCLPQWPHAGSTPRALSEPPVQIHAPPSPQTAAAQRVTATRIHGVLYNGSAPRALSEAPVQIHVPPLPQAAATRNSSKSTLCIIMHTTPIL
eukprot:1148619-Pelagomonas_calceolata.AAC.2